MAGPSALVRAIRARYARTSCCAVSVPAVMRACRLPADSVSSENGSVGALAAKVRSASWSGLQSPRSAYGGAGTVSAQRYMLGLTWDAGCRCLVPCSIA